MSASKVYCSENVDRSRNMPLASYQCRRLGFIQMTENPA